ncbi:hypothetical protein GGX14DRAFT_438993 [Mycena pura]|uniref:Protein FAM72A n=1 Tax=Mycena pura TaxID=153505 RepID=A0AAD6VPF0_9AGAR|nr:hypothetical protein GGX14DRAFT_438993 [Mycena pura]
MHLTTILTTPSAMFSYLSPWHAAPLHYILDCKTCNTFLTNRGMKAVLLLRPSVALYSSDALPVNCSAYTSNSLALRPATACPSFVHPLRTCECLTQTLCCHGCGSNIGYMIVIPCARCTSSVNHSNRGTNGHRFVFHSSEITGTERYYIPNEPSVIATQASAPPPPVPVLPPSSAALHNGSHRSLSRHPSAVAAHVEYLPSPPLDPEDITSDPPSPTTSFPFPQDSSHLTTESPSLPHLRRRLSDSDQFHAHYPHLNPPYTSSHPATPAISSESSNSSSPPLSHLSHPFGLPTEQLEPLTFPPLVAGDVLYWHHLSRHGEIPGVMEDVRARRRSLAIKAGKTKMFFNR